MQYIFKYIFRPQKRTNILLAAFILTVYSLYPKMAICQVGEKNIINIVFTSDAHYGITRERFRGDTNVPSYKVNAALIKQINKSSMLTLPNDDGIDAGKQTGPIDYLIETGDIANRMDYPVQTAAASWAQFEKDYINDIKLNGHNGKPSVLLLAPGNHDITNAIGYTKPMFPLTDPTAMVKIYNLMLKPKTPLTNADYKFLNNKINYSVNVKGIHMVFITLWPDSAERIWMEKDLRTVSAKTPVIIFTHDQPTCEASHFTNPLPPHSINNVNKFQNLVEENYKEGVTAVKGDAATGIEQKGFVQFLKQHPNIKAYFHGNSNYNEFYTYTGPDNDVKLNTFRVDSPMKGKYSANDETKLSYQLITMDIDKQELTVRECLWNTTPSDENQKVVFGKSATVSLKVN